MMKVINILATVTTSLCVIISVFQEDWTEAAAWSCVLAHNLRDLMKD